jgi:hypothetical protein
MNSIGVAAVVIFLVGWLGAAVSFFAFDLLRVMKAHADQPFGVWSDAKARPRFLAFVAFCALGPLAALVGFMFGGWPTN